MRTVGLGIQEFEKVRRNNQFYVDKTELITQWYRGNDDITLITRPRRFGKTLTIDMLRCFFSTTYSGRADLFEGLAVSRDRDLMSMQGTVPTITVSFSGVKGESFIDFLTGLAGRIAQLFSQYTWLLEENALSKREKRLFWDLSSPVPEIPDREKEEKEYAGYLYKLTHSIQYLSDWLMRCHQKKVYIFMDEYDTPIQSAWLCHYYPEAIGILRELFSATFKDNRFLDRAVITGITRIAKESLFSEMNNLAVCSVISGGYDRSFGFTQDEMDSILKEYELEDKRELLRFWYDGFSIGREKDIYNPWSVINYLSKRQNPPEDYWAQSGGMGLVDRLLRKGGTALKEGFEVLMSGGVIEKNVREDLTFPRLEGDENAVWSLLIAAGYIKPVFRKENPSGNGASSLRAKTGLTLTNHESLVCLHDLVNSWFETASGNYMERFADALRTGDLREMNTQMQQVVIQSASGFDSGTKPAGGRTQPENFFHGLTLGMLTCLAGDYHVSSNRESGFGRYDITLEPLERSRIPDAVILEFKVYSTEKGDRSLEDTARRARRQIEEKKYDTELLSKGFSPREIRKYGFGFRGKEVMIID